MEIGIERNAGTETLRFETVSKNLEGCARKDSFPVFQLLRSSEPNKAQISIFLGELIMKWCVFLEFFFCFS